jgi:hypothetical protein
MDEVVVELETERQVVVVVANEITELLVNGKKCWK